nr:PREDICTED: nuclear transition protein 2 [Rhinolophus sinicus]
MDTKAQKLPITHTQPHSGSRSQSHTCNHCSCSLHCQNCSPSCSWSQSQSYRRSRSNSQSPTGRCSPPGHQSQSPRSSPLPKHQKHTMQPHHCSKQAPTHSPRYPKNRKNVEAKVKRKVVKRSRRVYKTKRRSSGTFHAGGEGPQGPPDEGEMPSWTSGAVR